ncbi:MAG: hypothetical protein LBV28_01475 [Puniceicoccales bacterium]|jgi:hypothetical protein|nr:hypothetical protein [Puniceicoccales bacterium]
MRWERNIFVAASVPALLGVSYLAWPTAPIGSTTAPFVYTPYYFYGYAPESFFHPHSFESAPTAPMPQITTPLEDFAFVYWSPVYVAPTTAPTWDWAVQTSSIMLREADQAALTTLAPVMFSVVRPLNFGDWKTFRPTLSAGVGVLSLTREGRDVGETQHELRPMLHVGIGAEWAPSQNVTLRLGYDYLQLPVESSLNPDLPEQGHSVQVGVEVKF